MELDVMSSWTCNLRDKALVIGLPSRNAVVPEKPDYDSVDCNRWTVGQVLPSNIRMWNPGQYGAVPVA